MQKFVILKKDDNDELHSIKDDAGVPLYFDTQDAATERFEELEGDSITAVDYTEPVADEVQEDDGTDGGV